MTPRFDLAIVGAGIVGLAHALMAARSGKRVVVLERDAAANGASVRNFGFVTVTGQERGEGWNRARRSARIWDEVARAADIPIVQRGLLLVARRPEARTVIEEFLATEMGEGCALLEPVELQERYPQVRPRELAGALLSTADLRVESRDAIARLAAWLAEAHGVTFRFRTFVRDVCPPIIEASDGRIEAEAAIVCPNDEHSALFPERLASYALKRCRLQMMRVSPPAGFRLPHPVMSDLSLVRYLGFSRLASAQALRARLNAEQAGELAHGIHLIAVANADRTLIIGDSHHDEDSPAPAPSAEVESLILSELAAAIGIKEPAILERWTGTYPVAQDRLAIIDRPSDEVRLVLVTSGTGASTAFAIAEEVIAELYGAPSRA
jgi:FAD dependent oxidoreductase TIGR03364